MGKQTDAFISGSSLIKHRYTSQHLSFGSSIAVKTVTMWSQIESPCQWNNWYYFHQLKNIHSTTAQRHESPWNRLMSRWSCNRHIAYVDLIQPFRVQGGGENIKNYSHITLVGKKMNY